MAEAVSSVLSDLIRAIEDKRWFSALDLAVALKRELSVYLFKNYGRKDGLVNTIDHIIHTIKKPCDDNAKLIVCEMWITELIKSLSDYGIFYYGEVGDLKKAIRSILKRLDELTYQFAPSSDFRTESMLKEEHKVATELDSTLDYLSCVLEDAKVNKTIFKIFEIVRTKINVARSTLREYMTNPRDVKVKQAFIAQVTEVKDILMKALKMMENPMVEDIVLDLLSKQLGFQITKEDESSEEVEVAKESDEIESATPSVTLADILSDVELPDWVDDEWKEFLTHPIVVLIMGHTGEGKSALLYAMAEVMHIMYGLDAYFIWPDPDKPVTSSIRRQFPKWIKIIEPKGENVSVVLDEIPNNSIVIIDEAFIAFGARTSMKDPLRPLLQKAIELKRHKNISLLFVSQRARNIDVSVLNGLDLLMIKKPQELQVRTDRSELREYLGEALRKFNAIPSSDKRPFVYVVDLRTGKRVMKKFRPATFWNEAISHMFA